MKAFILLLILGCPLFFYAQISLNQWSAINPVTDSAHHNQNACLRGRIGNGTLFWDQQVDENTTRLCFKDLDNPLAEINILVEQTGIHMRHPKILELNYGIPDSDFVVFFETNDGNDIDLKYIVVKSDGTQSFPAVLSNLEGDDQDLTADFNSLKITWENTGKLYASVYNPISGTFSQPALIEPNSGHSPVLSNDLLSYLVPKDDSTLLISKRIFEYQGSWIVTDSSATIFYGQCSNLNSCSPYMGVNKCMQQDRPGENSGIIIYDEWNAEYFRSADYSYTNPAICDYILGVKGGFNFLAFESDSLDEAEIFIQNPLGFEELVNISQWPGIDSNPRFFVTQIDPVFIRVNIFWESERQGYTTIYRSYYDYVFGETGENQELKKILATPCPFNTETTFTFQSHFNSEVTIFDLQGRRIKTLPSSASGKNVKKAVWDGTNQQGSIVPAGCYIAVVRSGDENSNLMVIKK